MNSRPLMVSVGFALLYWLMFSSRALACDGDAQSIFSCEAAHGHKFIELCASSPLSGEDAYLEYRFGSLGPSGDEQTVEFQYPSTRKGSLSLFYGATYTFKGTYTQSVRFVSDGASYTVFTRSRSSRELGAGVEVRNSPTGKVSVVECSERPRFYISDLKGALACDPSAPVGHACIQ